MDDPPDHGPTSWPQVASPPSPVAISLIKDWEFEKSTHRSTIQKVGSPTWKHRPRRHAGSSVLLGMGVQSGRLKSPASAQHDPPPTPPTPSVRREAPHGALTRLAPGLRHFRLEARDRKGGHGRSTHNPFETHSLCGRSHGSETNQSCRLRLLIVGVRIVGMRQCSPQCLSIENDRE